ncbi:hypothetical protein Tco_0779364 [Tanacetum coccineum]
MSQSLSSNVPDNSPEQEAATGHSIPRRIDSPTSQATQLPKLGLKLTPTTGHEHSQEMNNPSVPALISPAPGPSRKRSRSPSSPFFPDVIAFSGGKPASETSELNPEDVTARLEDLEVEVDTLHADTEDKELLIAELQTHCSCESEMQYCQIRANEAEKQTVLRIKNKFRRSIFPYLASGSSSLAVTSSGLSSDASDAGLPSEKVVVSGKNGDGGDLLLFLDGPGACGISVGTLGLFISWECSCPVVGVNVSLSSGNLRVQQFPCTRMSNYDIPQYTIPKMVNDNGVVK